MTPAADLAALSQQSGARYLSLAFLQTATAGSCTGYWNGDTSEPIAASSYGGDIAAIQRAGGNVIPSFGGYTADTTDTEIADSCTSVPAIAQVYESLITTYNVPRIDLDVEADSLTNTAGINRRNEAIAMTEAWAAAHHRRIQFSYTLPTFPTGLTSSGLAVLQNAVADGAKIATVNLLTFDYYLGTQQDMVADTESAAAGLHSQLQSLYPAASAAPAVAHDRRHRDAGHRRLRPGRDVLDSGGGHRAALGAAAGDRADLVLGAAARQRRLSWHEGRGHLLWRCPAGLVFQPRVRALHPLNEPEGRELPIVPQVGLLLNLLVWRADAGAGAGSTLRYWRAGSGAGRASGLVRRGCRVPCW